MAQVNPEISTPMPALSTRRRFLSQAAGVAAGGTVLALATIPPAEAVVAPVGALASPDVDPIFALISRHRAEEQAYEAALVARDELHDEERVQQLCDSCWELEWALANTVPTSVAGVAALLRYANECEDQGDEWPDTDTIGSEGWHYQLRQTAARALEALLGDDRA